MFEILLRLARYVYDFLRSLYVWNIGLDERGDVRSEKKLEVGLALKKVTFYLEIFLQYYHCSWKSLKSIHKVNHNKSLE